MVKEQFSNFKSWLNIPIRKINFNSSKQDYVGDKLAMDIKKTSRFKLKKSQKMKLWLAMVVVLGFFYFTLIRPLQKVRAKTILLRQTASKTFLAAKDQDFTALQSNLSQLKLEVEATKKDLRTVYFYKYFPFVGYVFADMQNGLEAATYMLSAGEKSVVAIEPYADLIGFKKGSEFSDQPTEKRLETAILTIDKLVPHIDKIDSDMEKAKFYLEKIDPNRYPKQIGKTVVRDRLKQYYEQLFGLVTLSTDAKPLFKRLPYLLGKDQERRYLVLFLNDAELRPTGGFITAYAVFSIDKGKISVAESSDIYDLDSTINHPKAPPEIITYHKGVSNFHIRDSNLSPDYVKSIEYFEELLDKSSRNLDYDGIISIDTKVLVDILKVLGPTEAAGVWFKADTDPRCDCPQVIYELENIITRPTPYFREQRKSVLSVLLYNLMQKALGVSPSLYWGRLMQSSLLDADEKHILVYFKDKKSQQAIESLGYGGRIVKTDNDYLHISNTNFAGAKSNMYLRYKVESTTEKKGDKYERKLTLEYKNIYPASDCNLERGNLCLNATLRNWLRVYVPLGSKLVEFNGSQMKVQEYEDLGKQVFEGFLTVNPMGRALVEISYTVPVEAIKTEDYQLLIQKQPGVEEMELEVTYGNKQIIEPLRKDKLFKF